jgi:hypothetical protein
VNKTAIKEFAIGARKKLIASVKDKAGKIGITADTITAAITTGNGFAVFPTHFGTETTLTGKELLQRDNLISQIKEKGYDAVMEEVAYTWFNRIIAVRFMEVNDYLPSRIRVLTSEKKEQLEPDLVTQAPNVELDLTDAEKDTIYDLKLKNEMDSLFQMLFIKQCNELGEILPELFENTSKNNKDYTEILLDISYTNEDSVIRDLLKIDEADFLDAVEIIGWMYQYYISDINEIVYDGNMSKERIPKELLPAATQLFTPDWAVKYMVENSIGKLWLEGHENADLKADWKYYLDETDQEPEALVQLNDLKAEAKNLNLEEIKVIDPCMGSGHILVYAFEVLMQIYKSCGYTEKDAAKLIIEKNLYGLDIDDRAFQLAYFAVLMKGRKYNCRILSLDIKTNICGIQESNTLKQVIIGFIANGDKTLQKDVEAILDVFTDAKEYGSILDVQPLAFDALNNRVKEIDEMVYDNIMDRIHQDDVINQFAPLLKQAAIMAQKYDVVITNPPYLSSSRMSFKLVEYNAKTYPEVKSDFSMIFYKKAIDSFVKEKGFISFITTNSWMFLKSFEMIRTQTIDELQFESIVDFGTELFDGKVGHNPIVSWVSRKSKPLKKFIGVRLVDYCYSRRDEKEPEFFNLTNRHITNQKNFEKIPGTPIAYWVSEKIIEAFKIAKSLDSIAKPRKGLTTANDAVYLRFWYEVSLRKLAHNFSNKKQEVDGNEKWFPINKGGEYRKWYGNNEYIINWENDGFELKNYKNAVIRNIDYYFKNSITWNDITSKKVSFRYKESGQIFNDAGPSIFGNSDDLKYLLGFGNSIVSEEICKIVAPTIHYGVGQIAKLPVKNNEKFKIRVLKLTNENVELAKNDWDSFETSWDFKRHPLLTFASIECLGELRTYYQDENGHLVDKWTTLNMNTLEDAFMMCQNFTELYFSQLKKNEEELNRIFIEIYGLEDELTPEVEDKDITIRKADLGRDIRSLISYAVGCMLGRYSLDVEGLAYAGGEWEADKYTTIIPDKDNIIPITDEEYFDDDMVARLVNSVKVVYGEETLEENLDFIAGALGNKGNTSRDVIRNYFLKDFYKDHLKIYQKRPIYWLFDSGKENGFKALIYMHRYDEDTVGRVRTDYLHKIQAKLEDGINHANLVLTSEAPASDKASAVKKKEKLIKQLAETQLYDQAIAHIALQRIPIDLDDGVKVNYAKFQDVEVSSEGKKAVKVNLLAKI